MINIICEVYDILGTGGGASINEIQFFNKSGGGISYSTTNIDCFDSYTNNITTNWNNSNTWGRDNLKDGATAYISNATGKTNSTYFFGYKVKGKFARFLIQLNITNIAELGKIRTYIGDTENRTPVSVKYFYARNYDKQRHLNDRDNSDLQLLGNLNFSKVVTVSTPFDINLKWNKYLIKQGDNYYSIKDNQLTQLGTPTDDTQKEQWFNDYGVEDLKEALLIPDANGNKLIDSLNDQFEIRMMKAK